MITVKTGAYSTEEITALASNIRVIADVVQSQVCANKDIDCPNCKYYHLCTDLTSTYNFLLNKARERILEV